MEEKEVKGKAGNVINDDTILKLNSNITRYECPVHGKIEDKILFSKKGIVLGVHCTKCFNDYLFKVLPKINKINIEE